MGLGFRFLFVVFRFGFFWGGWFWGFIVVVSLLLSSTLLDINGRSEKRDFEWILLDTSPWGEWSPTLSMIRCSMINTCRGKSRWFSCSQPSNATWSTSSQSWEQRWWWLCYTAGYGRKYFNNLNDWTRHDDVVPKLLTGGTDHSNWLTLLTAVLMN